MVPDPTQIAQGSTFVNSSYTAYPIFAIVLGVMVITWAGSYVTRRVARLFGK